MNTFVRLFQEYSVFFCLLTAATDRGHLCLKNDRATYTSPFLLANSDLVRTIPSRAIGYSSPNKIKAIIDTAQSA